MKYINQISLILALGGVLIVVYTISSTFLNQTEFNPIPVDPVEIDAPPPQRSGPQSGFTTNRQPAATFSQILAERQGRRPDSPAADPGEELQNPDDVERFDTPLGEQLPGVQNPTALDRRRIPNRYLNPPENQPRPVGNSRDTVNPGAEPDSRASGLLGGSRSSRTPQPSGETTSPFGTNVQKRDRTSNPNPPPPRGSMQPGPPPP